MNSQEFAKKISRQRGSSRRSRWHGIDARRGPRASAQPVFVARTSVRQPFGVSMVIYVKRDEHASAFRMLVMNEVGTQAVSLTRD
jgi:hypothetical protein